MIRKTLIFLGVAAGLSGLGAALAATPDLIGSYRNWDAFVVRDDGEKICFMRSLPTRKASTNTDRGDVSAFVSHRTSDGVKDEISFINGYAFQDGSSVTVDVDGRKFTLFTDGNSAFLETREQESQIVKAMKAGSAMKVSGTSNRGETTTDNYSLMGFTAAHNAISQACK